MAAMRVPMPMIVVATTVGTMCMRMSVATRAVVVAAVLAGGVLVADGEEEEDIDGEASGCKYKHQPAQ